MTVRNLGFGDLHKAFLNKLGCSRHSIGVDLDVGKQIHISVIVNLRRGTTQFYLHATSDQVGDEPLIWVTRRYFSVSVVSGVMQCYMAAFVWKTATTWDLAFQSSISPTISPM